MSEVAHEVRWSDALATGHAEMDATHREFVALMNEALAAPDAQVGERLAALERHTIEHFARELAWMRASGFPPIACHDGDHQAVLQTIAEVRRRVTAGDAAIARRLVDALAQWFDGHAQTMDRMLATWLAEAAGGACAGACGGAHDGTRGCGGSHAGARGCG